MNFEKKQGEPAKDIISIIEEELQLQLSSKLLLKGQLNSEIENTGAYIVLNEESPYILNITYATSVNKLSEIIPATHILINEFVSSVPENSQVSFRCPIIIERGSDNETLNYSILFRAAILPKKTNNNKKYW